MLLHEMCGVLGYQLSILICIFATILEIYLYVKCTITIFFFFFHFNHACKLNTWTFKNVFICLSGATDLKSHEQFLYMRVFTPLVGFWATYQVKR